MSKVFFVGGCRSGKSRLALKKVEELGAKKKYFLATCRPDDSEMQERILKHQQDRGKDWNTLEEPLQISKTLLEYNQKDSVILVDCLTLWVNNLILQGLNSFEINEQFEELVYLISKSNASLVLVSNEVGTGIVPENSLARLYRDLVGRLNQNVAEVVDRVILTVAGIAVQIK